VDKCSLTWNSTIVSSKSPICQTWGHLLSEMLYWYINNELTSSAQAVLMHVPEIYLVNVACLQRGHSTATAFAWRDYGKPRDTTLRLDGLWVKIWTLRFPDRK
jgi:ATP/ADP translocase